jgi:GDP-L-fucose synthase
MRPKEPQVIDLAGARVMVTGGAGFLGRRITGALADRGANPVAVRSRDYDLTNPEATRAALADLRPRHVVHAAAVVGGIGANRMHPAGFFYENAVMGVHLIHEAWRAGVEKLVVVGTVCSYPKQIPVPFSEDELWDGYPEETNAPYGVAKKMLLVQCRAYRDEHGFNAVYVIPTNLYGPEDNFDLETSHVIPAMIRKFHEAKAASREEVVLWGTGRPSREFLHVDDAAEGVVAALERYDGPLPINLGAGDETTIAELAAMVAEIVGFEGRVRWDSSKPDGQPRRAVDGSRARQLLGWKPERTLREGLADTVDWYVHQGARPP